MNRSLLPLPVTVVIALAGCSAAEDDAEPDTPASSAPTEASAIESPSPSPTEAALPEAADGTDYDACFDGACEVLVTEPVDIPLDPALEVQATTASVTELHGWTFGVAFFDNGQNLGSATSNDMRENGAGPFWNTYDGAQIDIIAFTEGEAVIAISVPG